MAKVIKADEQTVTLQLNSGKTKTYPMNAVDYDNPKIGDEVNLYRDYDGSIFIDLTDEAEKNPEQPIEDKKTAKSDKDFFTLGVISLVLSIAAFIMAFLPIINNPALFIGIIVAVISMIGIFFNKSAGLFRIALILGLLSIAVIIVPQPVRTNTVNETIILLKKGMQFCNSGVSFLITKITG